MSEHVRLTAHEGGVRRLGAEDVISVRGKVRPRDADKVNRNRSTGEIDELFGGDAVALVQRQVDAELREHRHHALHGERGLRGLVAGAVEADDQAVADQLVRPHARERRDDPSARHPDRPNYL